MKWRIFFMIVLMISPSMVSGSPSKRIGPRMVYDPVDEQIILYGGAHWEGGYKFYGELWSYKYETNTWSIIDTNNNPPPRFNTMITYIPNRHKLFLFGGWSTNDRAGDTWIYDFETRTWTELHPSNKPSRRSDSSIAYDLENDIVVLYSGYLQNDTHLQDTWIYSFEEENWIKKNPENSPLGQYGNYMIYSESTQQLLMYPGHWSIFNNGIMVTHGYGGNIWEYNVLEDSWLEHESAYKPPGRYWGNIVYDSNEDRIILFGGHGSVDYDDTWIYSVSDDVWEKVEVNDKPSKRGSIGMAYDPLNHVVVLFGGFDNGQSLGDTWIFDCETLTWHQPETDSPTEQAPDVDNQTNLIPGFPALALFLALLIYTLNQNIYN